MSAWNQPIHSKQYDQAGDRSTAAVNTIAHQRRMLGPAVSFLQTMRCIYPGPTLQGAIVGLFDHLPHHLHVADGESSVNRKYGARDPSSLVRREEERGSCHILRLTDTTQWIPF